MLKYLDLGSREFRRYLVIGGLNAVLTGTIYTAGLFIFRWHYLFALIASFACGLIFTYVFNYLWVFRPEARFAFGHRFVKYVTSNIGTFGLNLAGLYYLVEHLRFHPFLAQVGIMTAIVLANFLFAKHWSLRRPPEEGLTIDDAGDADA